MRVKYFILLLLCCFIFSCNRSREITADIIQNPMSAYKISKILMPEIYMHYDSFDFGSVIEGELVKHEFVIENIGESDLIISSVKSTCGCTVLDWPKDPIFPGEKSSLEVTFNTSGKKGPQKKTITLVTNAIPNTKVITINSNVIVAQKK